MTYTALLILLILGDDLSGVNRRGVLAGLRRLQLADGRWGVFTCVQFRTCRSSVVRAWVCVCVCVCIRMRVCMYTRVCVSVCANRFMCSHFCPIYESRCKLLFTTKYILVCRLSQKFISVIYKFVLHKISVHWLVVHCSYISYCACN